MYSLRYGTVPVVRAVGGLADTACTPKTRRLDGIRVHDTRAALVGALQAALTVFQDTPRWQALQVAGMRQDFSWDRSAQEYVKIY